MDEKDSTGGSSNMSIRGKGKEGRAGSSVSCVSLKSDQSKRDPLAFREDPEVPNLKRRKRSRVFIQEQLPSCKSTESCQEPCKSVGYFSVNNFVKRSQQVQNCRLPVKSAWNN
ncbi:hypothetical protein Q5P01_007779 [Channa striata]|uniref:Uncharacterized protein n=1 Tax=Channa striata TaxID=64152 RepID=A0AA88T268_CHASR|nr:hypothetical protein Q5P01_007779 [Channa striata]